MNIETNLSDIASDILATIRTNPNGFTVESLVDLWKSKISWRGFKVGGKAWQREVLSQARASWIASTQDTVTRIPPSEETLAWGGFLGGEILPNADKRAAAEALFESKFGGHQ